MTQPHDLASVIDELRALRHEVDALRQENASLRAGSRTGAAATPAAQRPAGTATHAAGAGASVSRRGILRLLPAVPLAACGDPGRAKDAPSDGGHADGPAAPVDGADCGCPDLDDYLQRGMEFDLPLASPQVLDTVIHWKRKHEDPSPGYVSAILTLEQEGTGPNSYPWPLFVKVTGTPDANATMGSANAFGVLARLINEGPGFGTPFFSDLQHAGTGTDIGFDCELINKGGAGRTIGLNLLNAGDGTPSTNHRGDQAINIQSGPGDRGWETAILLERNPASNGAGDRGIGVDGQYRLGLDLQDNNMKLNTGAKIFLDTNETLYLWYNPANSHIEFRYLGNVLGYLRLDSVPHEM